MSDVAIREEGLTKSYRIDEGERFGARRYAAMEALTRPLRVNHEQSGERVGKRHRGGEGERRGALWDTAMQAVDYVSEAPIRW